MPTGRKPRPKALRVLEGKTKRESDEVANPSELPSPPADLSSLGLLRRVDAYCLAQYCIAGAMALEAGAKLESDGILVVGTKKRVMKHPAFQVWRDSVSAQRQFGEQLGCSPVARERVHAKASADNLTPMEELLSETREDGPR